VHIIEGKGLRPVDGGGRQDPYVVVSVDGQAAAIKKKTKVVTDGGSDLIWDEMLEIDIVDQYDLEIECYDHDLLADDSLIGKCTVSLLPVFKKGEIDTWVTLRSNQEGSSSAAGDIHVVFSFEAPYGIKYPQNQPGIDSFDEKQRIQVPKKTKYEIRFFLFIYMYKYILLLFAPSPLNKNQIIIHFNGKS
jgi:Ca2+-dependent lipid-binding protein